MISKASVGVVACIGSGVIGSGWAARFLENGFDVNMFDINQGSQKAAIKTLNNADIAYSNLTSQLRPIKGKLTFHNTVQKAIIGAKMVIESVPERVEIKQSIYQEIEAHCESNVLIASSTSGITPTVLQSSMQHPERFYVGHPFNPVYLIPLVEVIGGANTSKSTIKKAMAIYHQLGMHPVHLKKEIDAFVADRLLEAIWRESLWLIKDGICTTSELDDIVRYGFGLRYAQMGVFDTYRVAGGELGMRHFIEQFGPCLKWPWTKLTDVPELDSKLINLISNQSDHQSGHMTIEELERKRDQNLIAIQKSLKLTGWGAGANLKNYEKKLNSLSKSQQEASTNFSNQIQTYNCRVPSDWADYNGHMNEARYLDCFCEATDNFMKLIGCDKTYVRQGKSYFTVETHIRHLAEVQIGQKLQIKTQLIFGAGKRMHLFHTMENSQGINCATGEHMLIHVSLKSRSSCEPGEKIKKTLKMIYDCHYKLKKPIGLGKSIGYKS